MDLGAFLEDLMNRLSNLPRPIFALFGVIGTIIIAIIAVKIGSYIIKKVFEKQKSFKYGIGSKKTDTMSTLAVSVFKYTVYIVAIVAVVIIIGNVFNLTSILAAAGIGGIALGFGAQSLIRDIISGFFIVMEDQYGVGDLITVDNFTGTVEGLELRVTRFRNPNGDLYIIPNGEIKKVTNHTRGNKAVIVDIPISYNVDVSKAFEIANKICESVQGEFETIIEQPKVLGITDLGKDGLNIRIIAKTLPNEQWEVERRIRAMIIEEFEKENLLFRERLVIQDNFPHGGGIGGR